MSSSYELSKISNILSLNRLSRHVLLKKMFRIVSSVRRNCYNECFTLSYGCPKADHFWSKRMSVCSISSYRWSRSTYFSFKRISVYLNGYNRCLILTYRWSKSNYFSFKRISVYLNGYNRCLISSYRWSKRHYFWRKSNVF